MNPFDRHRPFIARDGLSRFGKLLAERKDVVVAYFGGSITSGACASDTERTSWRALLTQWLRVRSTPGKVREINAAIGGTGSDLAAYRLQQDVLSHRPDLILAEYAVNDSGAPPAQTLAMLEGVVRHALRSTTPTPELCFVYTFAASHLDALRQGALPETVAIHERIANHYGIPAVYAALPVAMRLADNTITPQQFGPDDCHPNDATHASYAETIERALDVLFAQPASPARPLPASLASHPIETGRLVTISPDVQAAGWSYRVMEKKGGWECFDGVLESDQVGAKSTIEFDGPTIGLRVVIGPDTGDLLWSIDSEPSQSLRLFDEFCLTFSRPQHRILRSDLTHSKHRLTIEIASSRDERSKGQWTRLAQSMCD